MVFEFVDGINVTLGADEVLVALDMVMLPDMSILEVAMLDMLMPDIDMLMLDIDMSDMLIAASVAFATTMRRATPTICNMLKRNTTSFGRRSG